MDNYPLKNPLFWAIWGRSTIILLYFGPTPKTIVSGQTENKLYGVSVERSLLQKEALLKHWFRDGLWIFLLEQVRMVMLSRKYLPKCPLRRLWVRFSGSVRNTREFQKLKRRNAKKPFRNEIIEISKTKYRYSRCVSWRHWRFLLTKFNWRMDEKS